MEELTEIIEQIDTKEQVLAFSFGALSGLVNSDDLTDAQKLSKVQYLVGYVRGLLANFPEKSDVNESL